MAPNHDHATLFVAPPAPRASESTGKTESAVDDGADAMRRLRHPFAIRSAQATVVESSWQRRVTSSERGRSATDQ
jgi:hypothetical protein